MKIDDFPYEVINSIDSVIELLQRLNVGKTERIFVIGAESLKKEISMAGFKIVNHPDCDYLIVGFDPEFNLNTVGLGLEALESDAKFIVCNREPNYPGENGHLKPGCGAIVAAIEASANCHPEYVAGKPSTIMLDILCSRFHCTPQEVLVIGDSLDSDISMANQYGVYSGWVSRGKDLPQDSIKPSFVISNLSELPDKLISINGEQ
jgi:HAD superfamily hydrolase (TIGR01450 family)